MKSRGSETFYISLPVIMVLKLLCIGNTFGITYSHPNGPVRIDSVTSARSCKTGSRDGIVTSCQPPHSCSHR